MRQHLFSIHIALLSATLSALGQGTFIYDQQSSTTNRVGANGAPIQADQPIGQSFTPALSSVGFVQFEFADYPVPNGLGATVYVNLRADSITGTILGTTDPVSMPDGFFPRSVTNFFFSTPVAVAPGTTYFFQLVLQSGDPAWEVIDDAFNYPGGTEYLLGMPDPGHDLWFREGVVPEPSAALLVLVGGSVLLYVRQARSKRRSLP